jgi:hypothetical protein
VLAIGVLYPIKFACTVKNTENGSVVHWDLPTNNIKNKEANIIKRFVLGAYNLMAEKSNKTPRSKPSTPQTKPSTPLHHTDDDEADEQGSKKSHHSDTGFKFDSGFKEKGDVRYVHAKKYVLFVQKNKYIYTC